MGALNVKGSIKVAVFKQFARSCLLTCPDIDATVNMHSTHIQYYNT